jgi:L-fucose mutarotase
MLKGIPNIISPELMKVLMEMGHGDEIVLADGNFPAASVARRLIRADGHNIPELLEAILKFFPLDTYVDSAVALMAVVPGDNVKPTIWEKYRGIIKKSGEKFEDFEMVERFAFYERAVKAYAVVATSEAALYANIILKKGVIKQG